MCTSLFFDLICADLSQQDAWIWRLVELNFTISLPGAPAQAPHSDISPLQSMPRGPPFLNECLFWEESGRWLLDVISFGGYAGNGRSVVRVMLRTNNEVVDCQWPSSQTLLSLSGLLYKTSTCQWAPLSNSGAKEWFQGKDTRRLGQWTRHVAGINETLNFSLNLYNTSTTLYALMIGIFLIVCHQNNPYWNLKWYTLFKSSLPHYSYKLLFFRVIYKVYDVLQHYTDLKSLSSKPLSGFGQVPISLPRTSSAESSVILNVIRLEKFCW